MRCSQPKKANPSEFDTVDLILSSTSETRGVDAFALALIKAERQLRKVFTHLIYQYPCFKEGDIDTLRKSLASSSRVYFEGFEKGINYIAPCTLEEMIGNQYSHLRPRIDQSIEYRNKIFHGQLTNHYLDRNDFYLLVEDIRKWCEALAKGAQLHIGYDGFTRNSFHKSSVECLSERFKVQFSGIDTYTQFIEINMRRR